MHYDYFQCANLQRRIAQNTIHNEAEFWDMSIIWFSYKWTSDDTQEFLIKVCVL